MKAKDMFEYLGYSKIEDTMIIEYVRKNGHKIRFWKGSRQIELFGGYEFETDLENEQYFTDGFKLFVAINQQVKELGWDNE